MKEGGILAGRYVLERQLARGGMGSVWRARHRQLGTPVAVKFMDGALAAMPDLRTRFEREALAPPLVLQIPNVVRIHDYGLDGGIPYIAMELLTGETMKACASSARAAFLDPGDRADPLAGRAGRHSAAPTRRSIISTAT